MSDSRLTTNDDFVLAYKYQTSYIGYDDQTGLDNIRFQRDEYFIPTMNICFNKDVVFKSNKPLNRDNFFYNCSTILKKTYLEKELVNTIQDELGNRERIAFVNFNQFSQSKIFENWLDISFFANENDFDKNYSQYGSFILPNYLMRYFVNENLDKNSRTANQIFLVITSLDAVEKASLETCLLERMMERDATNKKYNFKENPVSLSTGLTSMAIGLTTALITESAPMAVFSSGLVLFGKKKYDELMKNRCIEFKNKIFEALKEDQKIYSYQVMMPF